VAQPITVENKEDPMSFFGKILDKLGFDAGASKVDDMLKTPVPPKPDTAAAGAGPAGAAATSPQAAPSAPVVDVTAMLEQKAAANPQQLNWRTSIVDLLKLLDIDSSLQARKELATELHCPPELMNDSAKMNTWLHKAVMQKLAANGGKVPAELLD
jgi:nucleoid-associated protein YgaU